MAPFTFRRSKDHEDVNKPPTLRQAALQFEQTVVNRRLRPSVQYPDEKTTQTLLGLRSKIEEIINK